MGKFSQFAQKTKKFENSKNQNLQNTVGQEQDAIPAKDKNPDDLEFKG